jgi:hypothetical protein
VGITVAIPIPTATDAVCLMNSLRVGFMICIFLSKIRKRMFYKGNSWYQLMLKENLALQLLSFTTGLQASIQASAISGFWFQGTWHIPPVLVNPTNGSDLRKEIRTFLLPISFRQKIPLSADGHRSQIA